ncbi:MAG: AAA family ATPase [Desulfobacteraceae bacterium]|nr:AAA family ATPase [Desulfobacteraceae bacterium]
MRGGPGTGKTMLGMHFLTAGAEAGEKVLFITLGETESQLRENAEAAGFDVSGIDFLDLSPTSEFFSEMESYDIFSPAEVERDPTTQKIIETVKEVNPARVFIDSMTQFKYLTTDNFQFRKQVLSFMRFLGEKNATVIFTSEGSAEAPDDDLQFLADGIVHLEFTGGSRIVRVSKFRGADFAGGEHNMRISGKGVTVYPNLVPEANVRKFEFESISSGVPELDELLNGGLERGTITIVTGPSGSGKTTLGIQFMKEAAGRGEKSVVYSFEENKETLVGRCEAISIPIRQMLEKQSLSVFNIEPLKYSPGEFACMVRRDVEEKDASIVMIDSIDGYSVALGGAELTSHIHALTKYLANMGVTVLLVNEVEYITGQFRATEVGISYIADNVVFLRLLEIKGEIRKAIGVLKKRLSGFENTLRELEITRYGIKVGKPMTNLRGILSGTPTFRDDSDKE